MFKLKEQLEKEFALIKKFDFMNETRTRSTLMVSHRQNAVTAYIGVLILLQSKLLVDISLANLFIDGNL